MPAPSSISVTTAGVVILAPKPPGARRNFVILARQDADTRNVFISFGGDRSFTATDAAFWVGPGERHVITPDGDGAIWDLVNQGVFGKLSTGAAIDVQVQAG